MKPGQRGLGSAVAGGLLLVAGIWASIASDHVVWYGAVLVGAIWMLGGVVRLLRRGNAA